MQYHEGVAQRGGELAAMIARSAGAIKPIPWEEIKLHEKLGLRVQVPCLALTKQEEDQVQQEDEGEEKYYEDDEEDKDEDEEKVQAEDDDQAKEGGWGRR